MRYWALSVILVVTFLLQSVVGTYFAIGGVSPDFLLVLVITYGLLFGWSVGMGAGVLGGLFIDLMAGRYIGLHVLSLGIVGFGAGLVEERVFKENILLAPVSGLVGSVANYVIVSVILWLYGSDIAFWASLRSIVFPSALYNMVVASIVYWWIYRHYNYFRPDPRGTVILKRR